MNIIEQNIDLNVCYPNNYQIIHAIQGDNNTIKVTATIWDKNELYTIVADSVALEWQSPSGHKRDCPITEYTKHTVSFILTNELLAENGDNIFVIRFENTNDDCKRTSSACVKVSGAPYGQLLTDEIETITGYVNKSKEYYDNLVTEKGQPNGIAILDENGKVPLVELPDASTTQKGIVQLTDSISSTSTTTAATPNSVKSVKDSLNSEISRATNVESVLTARIDTITNLPEGSTTGDAELQDIRVKADGTIAENAGNAVREQISELKGDLGNLRFSITENNLLHVERKE